MAWSRRKTVVVLGLGLGLSAVLGLGTWALWPRGPSVGVYTGRLARGDAGRDVTIRVRAGGELVAEARVRADGFFGDVAAMSSLRSTDAGLDAVTDAAGTVRFLGAPSRGFFVTVTRPGFVRAGDFVGKDETEVVLELRRGVSITGRVVHADGRGVADARVRWEAMPPHLHSAEVTSDVVGRFELRDLPAVTRGLLSASWTHERRWWHAERETDPGEAGVEVRLDVAPVRHEVRLTILEPGGAAASAAKIQTYGRDLVPVGDGRAVESGAPWLPDPTHEWAVMTSQDGGTMHALVGPLSRLAGVVSVTLAPTERFTGRVVDEAGAPVAGVPIELAPRLRAGLGEIELEPVLATSDGEGRFVIEGARRGSAVLSIGPHFPFEAPGSPLRVEVPSPEVVVRGRALAELQGTLRSASGKTPYGTVFFREEGSPEEAPWRRRAANEGRFLIPRLRPGVRLRLRAGLRTTRVEDAAATERSAAPGEAGVAFVVTDGKPFLLRVPEAHAEARAWMTVPGLFWPIAARVREGVARFEDVDPTARVDVSVSDLPDERVVHELGISTSSGEATVRSRPGRTLTGRVVKPHEEALRGAVTLQAPGWVSTVPMSRDGSFVARGLPDVPMRVVAWVSHGGDVFRAEAREERGKPVEMRVVPAPPDFRLPDFE